MPTQPPQTKQKKRHYDKVELQSIAVGPGQKESQLLPNTYPRQALLTLAYVLFFTAIITTIHDSAPSSGLDNPKGSRRKISHLHEKEVFFTLLYFSLIHFTFLHSSNIPRDKARTWRRQSIRTDSLARNKRMASCIIRPRQKPFLPFFPSFLPPSLARS